MEVTIKEAADRLGVSVDTVRRRLKAGELAGRQEPHGASGYRWLVQLPDDTPAEHGPPGEIAEALRAAAAASAAISAEAFELADARARIEGLERLIDELAGQRDKLETERDDWKDAARRESEAARELRVLLKGAQDSTRALTATLEPHTSPELRDTPHGPQAAPDAPHGAAPAVSAWERLRRWAGGRS